MIKSSLLAHFFRSCVCICGIFYSTALSQMINTKAPPFSGTTMEGTVVRLSDYSNKVVLLDFWASWCGPCRQEMPFLIETDKKYKDKGLVILTVNIDAELENVRKFISNLEILPGFPIILDKDTQIPPLFQIKGMPTTILIDRRGIIRYQHEGFQSEKKDVYLAEINSLLEQKQGTQ